MKTITNIVHFNSDLSKKNLFNYKGKYVYFLSANYLDLDHKTTIPKDKRNEHLEIVNDLNNFVESKILGKRHRLPVSVFLTRYNYETGDKEDFKFSVYYLNNEIDFKSKLKLIAIQLASVYYEDSLIFTWNSELIASVLEVLHNTIKNDLPKVDSLYQEIYRNIINFKDIILNKEIIKLNSYKNMDHPVDCLNLFFDSDNKKKNNYKYIHSNDTFMIFLIFKIYENPTFYDFISSHNLKSLERNTEAMYSIYRYLKTLADDNY